MPRLNSLEDVLFPVEEHPVFVSLLVCGEERRVRVPEKKAIVNRTDGRVLGIVSRGYRLVSNREALEMADQCCRAVFPETKPGEWEAKAVDAPSTAGYCHIDLLHNTTTLDFSVVPANQRPEAYGPFIRVTNSYNTVRALSFDIGFYRKVCKNGMIVPETIIRFKFTHLHRDIGETIKFDIARERLMKFKATFADSLSGMRACSVPRHQFNPLICGVLLLKAPKPLEPESKEACDWQELSGLISDMSNRYADELGENSYAVFNAITELASYPPNNRRVFRDRHSLQRLAGSWFASFSAESRKPGFRLDEYLAELEKRKSVPEGAQ